MSNPAPTSFSRAISIPPRSDGAGPIFAWTTMLRAALRASEVNTRIWTGVFCAPNSGDDKTAALHRTKTMKNA